MTAMSGPVDLPGFTLERQLGAGGFADVFLYTQHMPRRRVAVKILREPVTAPTTRERFESEANVMAALSSHPSIVTIHETAIAANGRPYLVMEYCSRPNLTERYLRRTLPVSELLQTLIRVSGAVETAHRAGILHRDIKPANILTTDYGWPALTDFGISAVIGETTAENGAVSMPWAAPEAVGGHGVDRRSDVYSLGATAYTLLAGHSPFEDDTVTDLRTLVARVLTMVPPPLPREDVPDALRRLIALSLSKRPDERPQSAAEFARALQRIEHDLHLPTTHLDVPTDAALPDATEGVDDRTRLGGRAEPEQDRTTIVRRDVPDESDPDPDDRTLLRPRPVPEPDADDATVLRSPAADPDDRTALRLPDEATVVRRRAAAGPASAPTAPTGGRRASSPTPTARSRYGTRGEPTAAPLVRAAASPAEPAPPRDAGAPRRSRRRWVGPVVFGVGALVVLTGAAVGILALLGVAP